MEFSRVKLLPTAAETSRQYRRLAVESVVTCVQNLLFSFLTNTKFGSTWWRKVVSLIGIFSLRERLKVELTSLGAFI
ncbi:hypothetical protein VZT92_025866 [Zoarces viviparus]|uniref:Uncharacterized protein n=1 Tax=Zoarces viviparus TaxID=48416 RepID=A0AAW1DZ38_ZOAVI